VNHFHQTDLTLSRIGDDDRGLCVGRDADPKLFESLHFNPSLLASFPLRVRENRTEDVNCADMEETNRGDAN